MKRNTHRGILGLGILAISCLSITACSRPSVSGFVHDHDKPVASGAVRFVPTGESDTGAFIATIENGNFSVSRDDLAGEYQVIVEVSFMEVEAAPDFYAQLVQNPYSGPEVDSAAETTHEFTATLRNGKNVVNYDLSDAPAKPDASAD